MTIETKFNLGDYAFVLYDNQISTVQITSILTETSRYRRGDTTINYQVQFPAGGETKISESRLFETKDDLLATL